MSDELKHLMADEQEMWANGCTNDVELLLNRLNAEREKFAALNLPTTTDERELLDKAEAYQVYQNNDDEVDSGPAFKFADPASFELLKLLPKVAAERATLRALLATILGREAIGDDVAACREAAWVVGKMREALDGLPKTDDGVHIVPGMTVWSQTLKAHAVIWVHRRLIKAMCECHHEELTIDTLELHKVYSTRDAALAGAGEAV